jgi:N-methylhydantoinase A
MQLDAERARQVLSELGAKLGTGAEEAAEGVVRVINAGMERAIRRISVERGHDPREYSLVAFGGAAGMHACELAAGLGIRRVIVPYHPGLLSAWGAIAADVQRDYVQTVRLVDPAPARLRRLFATLEGRARQDLEKEGCEPREITVEASVDVRYQGQSYEIGIAMSDSYPAVFHRAHRRLYAYADEGRSLEVVNLRVLAVGRSGVCPRMKAQPEDSEMCLHRVRWEGRWVRSRRCARNALPRRTSLRGPMLVTDFSATVFVPPGWEARTVASGDLVVEQSMKNTEFRSQND